MCWSFWFAPALLLLPLACAVPAALPLLSVRARWRSAKIVTAATASASAAVVVADLIQQRWHDAVLLQAIMLTLVLFLAAVVSRFSERYLQGEHGQTRYIRALLFTVAAAGVVITAPRLDVMIAAWIAGSFSLDVLLRHYPERRPAQLAAHKKFLVSRCAELCLITASALLYRTYGTFDIGSLVAEMQRSSGFQTGAAVASVLVVVAVGLKSAQIPLHGWLMQVMEAPTPVSALLHAGVINLGGFVLIRLHPLLDRSVPAQSVATVLGSLTLLFAGVISMTRVSVKVRLAWSTCAQMGFLLAECGLGLYQLALVHLVGHSLYKAHAFLASGSTVQEHRRADATRRPVRWWAYAAGLALTLTLVVLTDAVSPPSVRWQQPAVLAVVCLGLAPFLAGAFDRASLLLPALGRAASLLALFLLWHVGASALYPEIPVRPHSLTIVFLAAMSALYLVQAAAVCRPHAAAVQRLRLWAFHGFYLDESFTRLVFALWPMRYQTHESTPEAWVLEREAA